MEVSCHTKLDLVVINHFKNLVTLPSEKDHLKPIINT
jgi:hypothetical protein